MSAHLEALERKHGALEEELRSAVLSPSADDLEIAKLKRLKLRIKDEIERLKISSYH